jgi:hypothetical protein
MRAGRHNGRADLRNHLQSPPQAVGFEYESTIADPANRRQAEKG